jgi:hypothetical protein
MPCPSVRVADVQNAIAAGWFMSLVPVTGTLVPTYRAIRSKDWLYVEWYAGDEHEYELYDMRPIPISSRTFLGTSEGALQHATTTAVLQARFQTLASVEACPAGSTVDARSRAQGATEGYRPVRQRSPALHIS